MATQQSKGQKATVERVMHEFKEGELKIRGTGPKVKSRRQAIAIALHEAGASNQEDAKTNRATLRKTKAKEAQGRTAEAEKEGRRAQDRTLAKGARGGKATAGEGAKASAHRTTSSGKSSADMTYKGKTSKAAAGGETKAQLYAEARKRGVEGRSRMSKGDLQRALGH